jgi:hypothetical protein
MIGGYGSVGPNGAIYGTVNFDPKINFVSYDYMISAGYG